MRLRDAPGLEGVLVLDPNPALLSLAALAEASAELRALVATRTQESMNPCNRGSWHGFLPLGGAEAAAQGLGRATCELLRKLGGLPALVSRVGWRPALPPLRAINHHRAKPPPSQTATEPNRHCA